ncbi:hypothetical protein [Aeromicrobium sp. UC242_57]|uniref:hypothetical protein n=1 Tax=Aeromicrobium sp. UC242_57 TaxID=3374624 RepID=UPI00379BD58D
MALSRGDVKIVVGTRAAAFAPVHDLGLVAMWDDGDDLFAEPRSPYPHAREVLLVRATQQRTAFLLGDTPALRRASHSSKAGGAARSWPIARLDAPRGRS